MSCEQYRERELGRLDESIFLRHARQCPSCQVRLQQDERLMALARGLEGPAASPFLWDRIEASLRAEQGSVARRRAWAWRAAAVLAIGLGLGSYIHLDPFGATEASASLYTPAALEKVRDREREYVAAIEELEQVANARLDHLDLDLMLLYRDKTETIDTQIARCLEALRHNPANTHIRRYLLLALRDKKETLQEIVQLEL